MLHVEEIELCRLTPCRNNPRINDHAVEGVAKSIRAFGFNVPILCDGQLRIIAGHTRWKAAKKLRMKTVPVIKLQMAKIKQRAFAIADNKTATMAEWDIPKLIEEMTHLQAENMDIQYLGSSDGELRALLCAEEDFDWDIFDESFSATRGQIHALVPVKVPITKKRQVKDEIGKAAMRFGIKGKDFATMAGDVLINLLGRCR